MDNLQINGVVTLKGFGTDRHGNPTAIFKGETGFTKVNPVVGDCWREMNIGSQYIIESVIFPVQTDDKDQVSIDHDEVSYDLDNLITEA